MLKTLSKPIYVIFLLPLLLSPAWYAWGGAFLLFVGFVPLLALEENLRKQNKKRTLWKFWGYSYLALLLWNISTTWWVWNSSPEGTIAMLLINSLFMSFFWLLFAVFRKKLPENISLYTFAILWLSFEFLHLNWDLSWTWLNLGNGFAYTPQWVQWYEYTGVLGGTLWVLLANIFCYELLKELNKKHIIKLAIIIFLPIVISYIIFYTYQEKGEEVEIIVVQPNVDPYSEKFVGQEKFIPYAQQADILLNLLQKELSPETKLVLFPETAFDEGYNESLIKVYTPIQKLLSFTQKYP
ncbi:MAG: apolipoprotein N-acyltransferase, partial [Thermonemataceae bacterium]|nr:apolipoprotein N-acyltransferase [Thermonemataceae bacterium]